MKRIVPHRPVSVSQELAGIFLPLGLPEQTREPDGLALLDDSRHDDHIERSRKCDVLATP
jgi:hypothetical protein